MTVQDADGLSAIRLVGETREPFRQLPGFKKNHRIPSSTGGGDLRYLYDLAQAALDDELQEVFSALRKSYGLKRKQISVDGPSDGGGVVVTPFFNYEVHVAFDGEPDSVLWRRLISEIREPARVFAGPFDEIFKTQFSILELVTQKELDLEAIVDHIEDAESDGVTVDYDKDLTWCQVNLAGSATSVLLRPEIIRGTSDKDVSPKQLLDSFLLIQQQFVSALDLSDEWVLRSPSS